MIRVAKNAAKRWLWGTLARRGYDIREKEWSLPELTDEDRRMLQSVRPFTMTTAERLWSTAISLRHAVRNRVPGDFVECGVWRGGQAMLAAECLRREQQTRRIWLFDTFAGMTPPAGIDTRLDGKSVWGEYESSKRGDLSTWCYASLEHVKKNMSSTGYPTELVMFVKGPVEDTLKIESNLPAAISVLRLDTDFYESTRTELEVLFPRVSRGGVVMIDDYGYWKGSRAAVDEYFSKLGLFPLLQPIDHESRMLIKIW